MTREEMLDKLHKIRVGAQPTVATMDMGLEYEYVTPDGYGDGFGGMGDWPVYRLENISEQFFQKIKAKLKDKTLMLADLEGTDLYQFYNHVFRVNRPEEYIRKPLDFFKELDSLSSIKNGVCYVLCDALEWEPEAQFYSSYDELEAAFVERYVDDITEWEEYDDDELANWLKYVEEVNTIPLVQFYEEDVE